MKRIRAFASLAVATGALLFGAAVPANAHSVSEAIRYGCGPGFGLSSDGTRAVTTTSGAVWGYVHLAYNSGTGVNCVVARKTAYHGSPSRVRAEITVENGGVYTEIKNDALHWVSVSHYARNLCVKYYGWIWNTAGTALAAGGRTTWGNCGP